MKEGNLLVLLSLFLFSTACKLTEEQTSNSYWIGKDQEQIIKYATEAMIYHIAPTKGAVAATEAAFLDYPILSGPKYLLGEELLNVKQLLGDTSTYLLDEEFKMCLFTPNIGLRLQDEQGKHLDFLICFDCNVLKIFEYGQEIFSEDFDPGRDELLMQFYPLFKEMPYFEALGVQLSN